ncbi:SecB-like chaperone SecBL [Nocardia takedensis]
MTTTEAFADVRDLLDATELDQILTYRVSARMTREDAVSPLEMRVLTRCGDSTIEVRLDAALTDAHGEYEISCSAIFRLTTDRPASDDLVREFAEKVGVLAVYPYVREGISQLARQLGQPRPTLPLLRAGQVDLLHEE